MRRVESKIQYLKSMNQPVLPVNKQLKGIFILPLGKLIRFKNAF
jgi:hypothetical protein